MSIFYLFYQVKSDRTKNGKEITGLRINETLKVGDKISGSIFTLRDKKFFSYFFIVLSIKKEVVRVKKAHKIYKIRKDKQGGGETQEDKTRKEIRTDKKRIKIIIKAENSYTTGEILRKKREGKFKKSTIKKSFCRR